MNLIIDQQLIYRKIQRGDDIDYFIETDHYPVHLPSLAPFLSRIQFPKSRAILIRTSPSSERVTLHILRDIDLYSSFANFEIDLCDKTLYINHSKHFISLVVDSVLLEEGVY